MALAVFACRDITAPRTVPGAASRLLNPVGTVVVSPGNMRGWAFYDDQAGTPCTDGAVCLLVSGPGSPPAGAGSAELATVLSTDGKALVLADYKGTRFDAITDLHYSTYRQSADAGNNLAIALQFNVDYDLTDQATGYQGRLVYEPYQGVGGNVPQQTWQTWDAKAGKWWGTRASVTVGGIARTNPCVQAAPCTWGQLLAAFPDVGVHSTYGAVVLKAGSGWPGFRGNVDRLTIGVGGASTTFDFELSMPTAVPLVPPDFFPKALFDSLGTVIGPPLSGGPFRRDIVTVEFRLHTPLAARQAAIDSIGGVVVGGSRYPETDDGSYYVRIQGGTTEALLSAVEKLHRLPQVAVASWWELSLPHEQAYRRPRDGFGFRDWVLDSTKLDPSRANWALEYVRAPFAWGCSVGSAVTTVAVIDEYLATNQNILGNFDPSGSRFVHHYDPDVDYGAFSQADHGVRVASILASVGGNDSGMTGMAWRARLILRDRFTTMTNPAAAVNTTNEDETSRLFQEHVVASGNAGASVINLSLAVSWPNGEDRSDRNQMERAERMHRELSRALERLADQQPTTRPLIVVSAGNDHVPADLAGYAAAKEDYPGQVLVVGGLDAGGGIWPQSNTGTLVDVYAPAVHVSQANGNDKIVSGERGTSFAAPLAAGTAVLLKDFDPSLTAADMITKIKAGARSEDGVLKLDAYGALKQAGRSSHAPLCGNRVYKKDETIVAQRGDGGPIETLITLAGQTPDSGNSTINVYHGGKRIDLSFARQYDWASDTRSFRLADGWTYDALALDGGPFSSGAGGSHDQDVWGYVLGPSDLAATPSTTYTPQLNWSGPGGTSFQLPIDTIPVVRPSSPEVVLGQVPSTENGDFVDYNKGHVGVWVQPRLDTDGNKSAIAMSPGGKYALVAMNFITVSNTASALKDCLEPPLPDWPRPKCADGTERDESQRSDIYRVDLVPGSTPRLIKTIPDVEIAWLTMSERDDEISWQTVHRSTFIDFRWAPWGPSSPSYGGVVDSVWSHVTTCTGRNIQYLAFDSSAVAANPIGAARFTDIPAAGGCNDNHTFLAGTMSPTRTPTGTMNVEPLKPSAAQFPLQRRRFTPRASAGQAARH